MLQCYICGNKTRVQYFDVLNNKFILKEKCINPYCRKYNKYIK